MENFNLIYLDSPFKGEVLFNRSVEEYMTRALGYGEECKELRADKVNLVLTLDMPLVSFEAIDRAYFLMKQRSLKALRLGSGNSKIVIGKDDECKVFLQDDAFLNIDGAKSLNMVYNLLRKRIVRGHLERGVVIYDDQTVFIDDTVQIMAGAKILPFCRIEGETEIEKDAEISASHLKNCRVLSGAKIEASHLEGSTVRSGATVGPFARLRGADIGEGCRIGDFVEVKASTLEGGVKAAHLSYIGDARVGERTNVGCGSVFCNYDGKRKSQTTVGKDCFIGANANLIAPINISNGAYIAAATTVTQDVKEDEFVIGRVREEARPKKEVERT